MSRIYIHSRKYRRRSRGTALLGSVLAMSMAIAGLQLAAKYQSLSQPADATIHNAPVTMVGYINPYFMFKDSSKWLEDKAQTSPNEVSYYQYVNGTAVRQLSVYIDKQPTATQLASARVLPVQILGGDSLSAGSLSTNCGNARSARPQKVEQISFDNVTMVCDPSTAVFSVVLAKPGGSYELPMSKSNTPETVVILYKDFSGHPDAQNIINIANSFKLI
ncbi:MAG TPA: hypothetical protein VFK97_02250 [Candidatus Saccharimonadales bacterium]|nr:hypothetical protein [Candidatus Saccharimonadales bacterium]